MIRVLPYDRPPNAHERYLMLHLWRDLRMDTKAISIELMFPESTVYSILAIMRQSQPMRAA